MGNFKNSKLMTVMYAVIALLAVMGVVLGGVALGTKSSQNDADGSIASVQEQIDSIKATIPTLESTGTELGAYIDTLEAAADLQAKLNTANTAIETLRSEIKADISESDKAALDSLNAVKTALEAQTIGANTAITAFQSKGTAIDEKLSALETVKNNLAASIASTDVALSAAKTALGNDITAGDNA